MDPAPEIVVVGHVTLDACDGGYQPGGAAYAAVTAARLGLRVGLVTSFGPEMDLSPVLAEVNVGLKPAPRSTVFRNSYRGGRREQTVLSVALPLSASDVPTGWRDAPLALMAPMAGEVGPELLELFGRAVIGACPQGWMRRWDEEGRVQGVPWSWADAALARVDAVVLSQEDIEENEDLAQEWSARVRCLLLTCGKDGAYLYYERGRHHIPAFAPSRVVDPTGAGDAFAAAFLVRWYQTGDPLVAARFASLVGSFVVEAKGLAGVPSGERAGEAWRRLTAMAG